MAIKQMKYGRAIGEDGVAVEMMEAMEWWGIDKVTDLSKHDLQHRRNTSTNADIHFCNHTKETRGNGVQ